jgi:hypothetical protein
MNKKYYEKLKDQGKCLRCYKGHYEPGIYCNQCNREKNDHAAQKGFSKKCYEKKKAQGICINCGRLPAKSRVRCEDCAKIVIRQGVIFGWINLFGLYLKMGGKCKECQNGDLRILVIDHVQYYNHHKGNNGKMWNKQKLRARQSAKVRTEILQEYKEGKLQLLCANCNRLKELKRIGCEPYIQDALENKYSGSWNQRTYGWINKFNLLKDMGGRCFNCEMSELAALEIHHTELFHHSKNNLKWRNIQTRLRRNKGIREEILQRYRAGNYFLLCCNCNVMESQKQVRSEPHIQQALIKLGRLNRHRVLQTIVFNIVICLIYLFVLCLITIKNLM